MAVESACWVRCSRQRDPGVGIVFMCLSLYLHRVCGGIQHHPVHWHGGAPDFIHGLNWHNHLEAYTRSSPTPIEDVTRQVWSSGQHCLDALLRRGICYCILPARTKSTSDLHELGHCGLFRGFTDGFDVLPLPSEISLCWTGDLCQKIHLVGGLLCGAKF